ncbi:MAG: prepilin peptidase [Lachnospiraceae bacterium]|nr:prepilin peptidase [Lachnospiraceae bacterium]
MNAGLQLILYRTLMAVIGLLLLAAGIVDMRKRQISRAQILILLLVCCAVIPLKNESGVIDAVGGLAIGLCAIGVSVATREQIGRGDGIVIAAVGIALGARKCLLVVFIASFMMSVAAIVVLSFRKGGRQTRLPFLPAIFAGYLLCFLL